MREILFRGKTEKGEWVQGDLLHPDLYENGYAIEDFTKEKNNCFDVIPETVGQYTGLTDKNGTKIFEGDIIRSDNGHISVVVFNFGAFCLYCECHKVHNRLWSDISTVIGNIHDNPELLKGGVEI